MSRPAPYAGAAVTAAIAVLTGLGPLAAGVAQVTPPRFEQSQFPFVLDPVRPLVTGPIDQRFFGTYCQPAPKEFCKSVFLLPDPCVTLRDFEVHLDHVTTPEGGLLHGNGQFFLDGERGVIAVAGSVLARGRARFAATAPGLGAIDGADLRLSSDGLALTIVVPGKTFALRKDACGNNPPAVTLAAPFGPTFPFGQSVMLTAQISDEDTSFPEARQVFVSDRQGLLMGTRIAGGRTLFTSTLQPGNHRITFTATDSGGLTGQASLDLTVVNRPPTTPRIFLPAEGATLVAGAPVLLQGQALDPDTGFLTGGALVWSAQSTPDGPFVDLGAGNELGTIFAAPADPLRLRLTAKDSTGLTAQAERQVRVIQGSGNAPPVVAIRQPERLTVDGSPVAGFFATQTASFLATAFDVEDAPPDLDLRWEFIALQGSGGAPDPSPAVPNPAPVTGSLAAEVVFPLGANTFYRVTFQATDQGGLTSSDSIEIFVVQGPIL